MTTAIELSSKSEPGAPVGSPPQPSAVSGVSSARTHARQAPRAPSPSTRALALAALGVVFGDIGTSPLYALKECIDPVHGVPPTASNVLGLLSLVLWSLIAVVSVKYVTFIMRADNRGEGGILALLALTSESKNRGSARLGWLTGLVIFGAALLYGDGVITPAISVISAVEGLTLATSAFEPWVVPLTCAILVALFTIQKRGTERVGQIFGPIMAVWFVTLAALAVPPILRCPAVLAALSPVHAARFLLGHGAHGFAVLGAVVLVITGGEALYADMGHFGRYPIQLAWFGLTLPALALNYFGQGALVLLHPEAAANPFFSMAPPFFLYALVGLSTAATIIASQALISGSYSLTQQAVQLGLFPRVTVVHTSAQQEGQIYVPEINAALAVACVWLVLSFKQSSALAAAYGIAVTGTMSITSIIYYVVVTKRWGWSRWAALPLVSFFLCFDVAFLGANLLKFFHGGWVPVLIAAALFVLMTTWKKGRAILAEKVAGRMLPLELFLDDVARTSPHRVSGTAVFMTANPSGVPIVLLHHWKHNQVLHRTVVLLSITSEGIPYVTEGKRMEGTDLGHGVYQITARFGFMETPNVPRVMRRASSRFAIPYAPESTSYYLGRETLLTGGPSRLARWRKALFSFVSRNARSATQYFAIPPDRVVEIGMQIDL